MKNAVLRFPKLTLLTFNLLILFDLFMGSVAFSALPVRRLHTCVIQADSTIVCWGLNQEGQAMPPTGIFLQVSLGGYHSCGIRTDNTVACWGSNDEDRATPPNDTFLQISAGLWHNCGVKTDHTLACWGSNDPYWRHGEPKNSNSCSINLQQVMNFAINKKKSHLSFKTNKSLPKTGLDSILCC